MENPYMSKQEIQTILMDMLHLVDWICKNEGIQYFLSGGTLLGAVRHKGFIPWDDDVDLMMLRGDYERFLQAAPKYMKKHYRLVHCRTTEGYVMPWLRIWDMRTAIRGSENVKVSMEHLFVDVFPIDALPRNKVLSKIRFKKIRALDIMLKCSRRTGFFYDGERLQWLKKLIMKISALRDSRSWAISLDKAAFRGDLSRAKYAGVVTVTHYGERERMPIEVFRGSVPVTFEGESYPAPIGWDTYLRGLYRDYMQLPPEEKRISDHNIHAYMVSEEEKE